MQAPTSAANAGDAQTGLESIDVAIVGAGPAGLSTAYHLRESGLRVRVFESSSEVGGRTRSVDVGGEIVNTGAMFVYVGTETDRLCDELGISTIPVTPPTFGVRYDGRVVIAADVETLLDDLHIPDTARTQLARIFEEGRLQQLAYPGVAGLAAMPDELVKTSFSAHIDSLDLGELHPVTVSLIDNAVRGGGGTRPDSLSMPYALRYFASYVTRSSDERRYIPEGMQHICKTLHQRLIPGVVRFNSTVQAVLPPEGAQSGNQGPYELRVASPEGVGVVRADRVVFAVPGPAVPELAPWLPQPKLDAIERVPTNQSTAFSVTVDSTGVSEWDDFFMVVDLDGVFDVVMQPRTASDVVPSRDGRTTFICYANYDSGVAGIGDSDNAGQDLLEHFFSIVPRARGRVISTLLTHWTRCFAYPRPDRRDVVDDVRASMMGLHFAGDYASNSAGSHGAFAEGKRVASEIVGGN